MKTISFWAVVLLSIGGSMQLIQSFADRVAKIFSHIVAALLLSMFVVFILQIIFRYFLGWPVLWTVEWVTIAWLWGILLGFTFVSKSQDMIRLDIFYQAAPPAIKRVFDVFAGLVTAGIFAWTLPAAWDYVDFMQLEKTAAFRWPFHLVFGIYIPFHIAVIVRMLLLAWGGISGAKYKPTQSEEVAS